MSAPKKESRKKVAQASTFLQLDKDLPETIGDRDQQYAEFQAATQIPKWGKEFLASLDATMRDAFKTNGERVMAWVRRQSWGRYSLYCVLDDRNPAYASDCARELKLNAGTVSRILSFEESRGYIERRGTGKIIYPAIAPEPKAPSKEVDEGATFATFIEGWKVAHATTFAELEVAEATVKRIRKVVLAEWHAVQRQQQSGAPSILPTIPDDLKTDADPASSSESSAGVSQPTTTPNLAEKIVRTFMRAGKDNPTPKQLREVIDALPQHPDAGDEFVVVLAEKIERIRHPGALMSSIVPGFLARWPSILHEVEEQRKAQARADAINRANREELARETAELEAELAGFPPQSEEDRTEKRSKSKGS